MPKIKRLNMNEVSGVDYPAHLANGWSVAKSVDKQKSAAFFRAVGKDDAMTTKVTAKSVLLGDATPDQIAEIAKALTPEQLQPIIDAVNEVVEDAIDNGADDANENPDGSLIDPSVNAAAKEPAPGADAAAAAAGAVPADGTEDDEMKVLQKALAGNPAAAAVFKSMQSKIEKAQADAAEAAKTSAIEKALRLDNEAVSVSKAAYPHLAIDHGTVAPAIRKFAETDPKTAGVLTGLLKAMEGQAESAAMFKELGATGGGMETDAWGVINKRAEEIATETKVSKAVAISKALEERPELYTEYRKQVG